MYVKDVKPDRWRRSMQFLRTFADALSWKGDRVALALFAHTAAPQLRLTKDPNSFFFFLDHLGDHSPFRLEDTPTWDTNIEKGIDWGIKLVEKDQELFGKIKNPKGFVVITDGQAWTGDVAIALPAARQRTHSGQRRRRRDHRRRADSRSAARRRHDARRRRSTPILDRESLRQIASAGGGEYFEMGHEPDRDVAFRIIDSVKRRAVASLEAQAEESREELYWQFLFVAGVDPVPRNLRAERASRALVAGRRRGRRGAHHQRHPLTGVRRSAGLQACLPATYTLTRTRRRERCGARRRRAERLPR